MPLTATHPRATYRIQAHADFGFDRISDLAGYLAELGISHVYLSPVFTAVPGSQHGYDVIDHEHVNPELGGTSAHVQMCETLKKHGLEQLLDIVPNHMAIVGKNRLWWDVLENGPSSHYAAFFDVDWEGGSDTRVLLPILGEHYIDSLQQGLVRLVRHHSKFIVHYHDHRLPAAPRSLGTVLRHSAPDHDELCFLADSLEQLSAPTAVDPEATQRRQRDKTLLFTYLTRLLEEQPELGERIDARLEQLNQNVVELDAWLERQNWRIAHWHNATTELGYRRFFDVNTLAGLRVEDPRVFERVHRLVLRWLKSSVLTGIRIDHVDGLRDPQAYLQRLRQAAPDAWIVVEKILADGESLKPSWPVDGTTGYEFIRLCDQLFVDPRGEEPLTELARHWDSSGQAQHSWDEQARSAKEQILREVLASEREHLIEQAQRLLTQRIELRDCTRRHISGALTAILVSYPTYRSYVRAIETENAEAADVERNTIAKVVETAKTLRPDIDARVFTALEEALTLKYRGAHETEFALRVQQVTGAVTAKAIEDTLFYRHARLLALNEVGGSPERFGLSVDSFHTQLEASDRPRGMLCSATHDTKRGEDTRARLLALSELPDLWAQAVQRWSQRTQAYRSSRVDRGTEYFFYQTLVGAHPLTVERALEYMQKVVRERKLETSWIRPDTDYEAAIEAFIRSVFADRELIDDVAQFAARIANAGYVTSLARTLIKLTAPGIPDFYQGSELWDFSLVDPDNRRPIDFEVRKKLLAAMPRATPESVLADMELGAPKLWLIWKALNLRKTRPELFLESYRRLRVDGPDSEHVVAFARGGLVGVVPRLNAHGESKQRTATVHLPEGRYRSALVPDSVYERSLVPTSELWARFPVALLVKES